MDSTKIYGFTSLDNIDAQTLQNSEAFCAKLMLMKNGSGEKAIWLYETEEAAKDAWNLAFVIGLAPEGLTEYDALPSLAENKSCTGATERRGDGI